MNKVIMACLGAVLLAACGQSVFEMEVGMCFNGSIDGSTTVETVECTEPHESEVYALFDYTETDVYPGETAMAEYASDVCLPAFEGYVGVSYEESEIYASTGYPSVDTWDDGDREIVCSLNDEAVGTTLVGSMSGANR
ncbi:MAG: septum formation family protein [Acidimicrobiia bacterium]